MLKFKVLNYQIGEFQEKVITPQTAQTEWIIGRTSSCDLVLASPEVSRTHGKIDYHQGHYYFSDLGSTDGSRLNHEVAKVNQRHRLKQDDIIRVGDFVLVVEAIETPLASEAPASQATPQPWQDELMVRCVRVIRETEDVKTFCFVAAPSRLFAFQPGQFVTLELAINGQRVRRSYSISSSPSRPHTLDITVKRVPPAGELPQLPPGLVSNWLHDNLTVGSEVKLCGGPMGKFTCATDPSRLLMISAGSGITPMLSMTRWLYDTASDRNLIFFHSAKSDRDIVMRQELELMAARQPNFRFAITLTQPEPNGYWLGYTGRLTEGMLLNIAPDFRDRSVYVCGPERFMQGVKAMFASLSFPMENYHEESFGVSQSQKRKQARASAGEGEQADKRADLPHTPLEKAPDLAVSSTAIAAPAQTVIHFAQSQEQITCKAEDSILEVAQQNGIKIRSGCLQGVCGACKKRKLEGQVRYEAAPDALDSSEQEQGYILPCVAYPVGKVVIEA